MSQGPVARSTAYRTLFAPRLTHFISLENPSLDAAVRAAESFFSTKKDIRYSLSHTPVIASVGQGSHVTAEVEADFATAAPAALVETLEQERKELAELHTERLLRVDIETDADGRVISYLETQRTRHFRVTGEASNPTRLFPEPESECAANYADLGPELPPRGTLVDDLGEYLQLLGCGPGVELVRHVRYAGLSWWVLETSYLLVDNPGGGTSVGGIQFIERAD